MSDFAAMKDVMLIVTGLCGAMYGAYMQFRAKMFEQQTARIVAEINAKTKHDDDTGQHLLKAWELEQKRAESERAAAIAVRVELERERATSEKTRQDLVQERQRGEALQRQARSDNELAEMAMEQNQDCQKQLDLVRKVAFEQANKIREQDATIREMQEDMRELRKRAGMPEKRNTERPSEP